MKAAPAIVSSSPHSQLPPPTTHPSRSRSEMMPRPMSTAGIQSLTDSFTTSRLLSRVARVRCTGAPAVPAGTRGERLGHQRLGLGHQIGQMLLAGEALGVDLIEVFGAGWPCSEPAVDGRYLHPTDRLVVAARAC